MDVICQTVTYTPVLEHAMGIARTKQIYILAPIVTNETIYTNYMLHASHQWLGLHISYVPSSVSACCLFFKENIKELIFNKIQRLRNC